MYKLMIVDDEFIERDALRYIISGKCPEISTIDEASNGREALSKISSFMPDIVIMDIKMPGINGIEASRLIKQINPDCRIILLTAFNYFDYAKEAIKIGVEDFLIKPASDEEVISLLESIISSLGREKTNRYKQIDIENKLEQVTRYLENELVSSLITGEIENEQINEYLSLMNLKVIQGFCLVLNIIYNSNKGDITSLLQKDMIRKRCTEKLKQEFKKSQMQCLVLNIKNNTYALVLSEEEINTENMTDLSKELVKRIFKMLIEHLGVDISIGIGSSFNNINDIANSFARARNACKYISGESCYIHFGETEKNQEINKYPVDTEKELFEKIILGDEAGMAQKLDEIFEWIFETCELLEDVRRKSYELIVVISRWISQESNIGVDYTSKFHEELNWANSNSEVKTFVKISLKNIMDLIGSLKLDRSEVLINKVCEHIKNNYMKDISLDEMAGMVNLSSFYFSKIFKSCKKLNFIEYVTDVRIKKAKELLKDPMINIKDIGDLVGYNDPNYFTRVFKRTEGITPSEYRSKKMLL